MSKSEILYVKGMNFSESEVDENGTIWDDKKLNDAYDKAVRVANVEVAKRVAMSTNTPQLKKEDQKCSKSKPSARPTFSKKKKNIDWKAGMPCRAVYEGDGLEYEAFVMSIINEKECVVRFLGYENSELALISDLKPTLGSEERTLQIEHALNDKVDDNFGSQSSVGDGMEFGSDRIPSPGSAEKSFQKKRPLKKKKNQKRSCHMSGFELPEMPLPMPNISMLRNLGSLEMPIPPPPVTFLSQDRTDSEDQAISSMLLSWYMSGYYTGLYQGLKKAKENRRND